MNPNKHFYHCFGCGTSGDAINFVRQYFGLNFVEAVEKLAQETGIPVPEKNKQKAKSPETKAYTELLSRVAEFYFEVLKNHEQRDHAVTYLKARGLTGQTAKTFWIGYAPSLWDNLVQCFQNDTKAMKDLDSLGLIIRHQKGHYYDRFRNRIMFPIRNRLGEVIGFGGRSINPGDTPKYMNSPESLMFHKGDNLYGIYEALQVRQQWKTALCVEGYMDVIGLYQQGIYGAFATLGTALTQAHIRQLFKQSDEIIFCFDGDNAGRHAAWKALEMLFPIYQDRKRVKFLFLPEGEDPDSFVRTQGRENFVRLWGQSLSFSEYFFSELCQRYVPDSVENRAQFISVGTSYIQQLPSGTYQQMMLEALAQFGATTTGSAKPFSKTYKTTYKANTKASPPPPPLGPAFIASGLLLSDPSLIKEIFQMPPLDQLSLPGASLLQATYEVLTGVGDPEQRVEQLLKRGFTRNLILQSQQKVDHIPASGRAAELLGALDRIMVIGQDEIIESLLKTAKERALTEAEKALLKKYIQEKGIFLSSNESKS